MLHNTWPTRENASKLSLGWDQLLLQHLNTLQVTKYTQVYTEDCIP